MTLAELKEITAGNFFGMVANVVRGNFEIVSIKRITKVNRTKSFDPINFIGKGWSIWRGPTDDDGRSGEKKEDHRALLLTEIDWDMVLFQTCLVGDETSINGEEKLRRLVATGNVQLDVVLLLSLWYEKGHKTLEYLRRKKGVTYIDAFGTVLRNPDGYRCVLYLRWGGTQWDWSCYWLGLAWAGRHLSVGLASQN